MQVDLFSAASLARTIQIPPAPELDLSPYLEWPLPGLTPRETALAVLSRSNGYTDMLAAVIKAQGGNQLSQGGVEAFIPDDWRQLMGTWLHASMAEWQCKHRGVELSYLSRPDGGVVSMYRAMEGTTP